MKNKRFNWLASGKTVEERIKKYRMSCSLLKNKDERLLDTLTDGLANDKEVLSSYHKELEDIMVYLLSRLEYNNDYPKAQIFSEYLLQSDDEDVRAYANKIEGKISRNATIQLLSGKIEETQNSTAESEPELDEKEISNNIAESEPKLDEKEISNNTVESEELGEKVSYFDEELAEMIRNSDYLKAKVVVHRFDDPNKQKIFQAELERTKNIQALNKCEEFRNSDDPKKHKIAEKIEKEIQEREKKARRITKEMLETKDPLEDEILPLVMKNAMLDPEGSELAEKFALRYLKDPTCFRSIEKEAICVMLVNIYRNQGNYSQIINVLSTLMDGLNSTNRTSNLNSYERELLYDLGEAYLYQSQGKISQTDMDKLLKFVNNFSNPDNPNHTKFKQTLIQDLKAKEELLNVSVFQIPVVPPTTPGSRVGGKIIDSNPVINKSYSTELSAEKRLEYICQKELANGLVPKAYINLEPKNFTGYIAIRGTSKDESKQEPFYHVEKIFDLKKVSENQKAEYIGKLRNLLANNPDLDIYTLIDIAINQIGIPKAYGAASYLVKADESDIGIFSELGELVQNSKRIEEFEQGVEKMKTLSPDERKKEAKDYRVLNYTHTTGENFSNPRWYAKTDKAYDAFRGLTLAVAGETYVKSNQESEFEKNSRNKRVTAYISTPGLDINLGKIYELMDMLEDYRMSMEKIKANILDIQRELELTPGIEAEGVAEADVILDEIARIYKKKYKRDIYADAEIVTPEELEDEKNGILRSSMGTPKTQKQQKIVSKETEEYDPKYKKHKKEYKETLKEESVYDEDELTKEKMIELLKEYREFSYEACKEYREKIKKYKQLEEALSRNKTIQKNIRKNIDDLKNGKATVDPVTGEIIPNVSTGGGQTGTVISLGNDDSKTGTDSGR